MRADRESNRGSKGSKLYDWAGEVGLSLPRGGGWRGLGGGGSVGRNN